MFVCGDFSFRRETREDKERAEAPCEEKQDESQCLPLNLPVFFFFFLLRFLFSRVKKMGICDSRVSCGGFGFN